MAQSPTEAGPGQTEQSWKYAAGWAAVGDLLDRGKSFSGRERHCAFLNTGEGRFVDVSAAAGFDLIDDGRALARVDWDGDGDLDLWVTNRTAPRIRFLRNDHRDGNHWLALKLVGRHCNRDAIGARVEAHLAGGVPLMRTLRAGQSFMSQSSKRVHFGLGPQRHVERLVVRWPDGEVQQFDAVEGDQHYRLVQGEDQLARLTPPKPSRELTPSVPKLPAVTAAARVVVASPPPVPPLHFTPLDDEAEREVPRGKPQLVNLWSSSCAACVGELAEWTSHVEDIRGAGLDIVALCVDSIDSGETTAAVDHVARIGFPFAAGRATEATMQKLGLLHQVVLPSQSTMPVPISFLIASDGRLVAIYKGQVSAARLVADVQLESLEDRSLRHAAAAMPGRWCTTPSAPSVAMLADRLAKAGLVDDAFYCLGTFLEAHAERPYPAAEDDVDPRDFHLSAAAAQYATLLRTRDETKQAIPYLHEAARRAPANAARRIELGNGLMVAGDDEAGSRELERALQLGPPDAEVLMNLGMAGLRRGRPRETVAFWKRALEVRSPWPELANNLAWLLATHPDEKVRDGELAVRLAEKICHDKGLQHAILLDTLAVAYAEAGRFDEAVQTVDRAIERAGKDGQDKLIENLQGRRERYIARQPFHEEVPH